MRIAVILLCVGLSACTAYGPRPRTTPTAPKVSATITERDQWSGIPSLYSGGRFVGSSVRIGENQLFDIAQRRLAVVPQFQVFRHAANDGSTLRELVDRIARKKEPKVTTVDFIKQQAARGPAVKRLTGGEKLIRHHVVVRTAEHENYLRIFSVMIPQLLKEAG